MPMEYLRSPRFPTKAASWIHRSPFRPLDRFSTRPTTIYYGCAELGVNECVARGFHDTGELGV
jgi:hypothetical protein